MFWVQAAEEVAVLEHWSQFFSFNKSQKKKRSRVQVKNIDQDIRGERERERREDGLNLGGCSSRGGRGEEERELTAPSQRDLQPL